MRVDEESKRRKAMLNTKRLQAQIKEQTNRIQELEDQVNNGKYYLPAAFIPVTSTNTTSEILERSLLLVLVLLVLRAALSSIITTTN